MLVLHKKIQASDASLLSHAYLGHDDDHIAVRYKRLLGLLVTLGLCLFRGKQLEWLRHINVCISSRKIALTSCLVSSTLFPRASLAAVARSPTPTLLSLAIPIQAVSWEIDFGDRRIWYLCCPPSWPQLRYLGGSRDLGSRCSFPSGLVDGILMSSQADGICDDSLDSLHVVLAKKFNRAVWFWREMRLLERFGMCDWECVWIEWVESEGRGNLYAEEG